MSRNVCRKAKQKLSVLSRMAKLLSFNKRRTLFKAFVESQFKYCPIAWIFYTRRTNNKINRLHERALRIVYDDDFSTFHQLLVMDKSFCIHHQNIQRLLIEICIVIPSVNSVLKGKNSLIYFGSLTF